MPQDALDREIDALLDARLNRRAPSLDEEIDLLLSTIPKPQPQEIQPVPTWEDVVTIPYEVGKAQTQINLLWSDYLDGEADYDATRLAISGIQATMPELKGAPPWRSYPIEASAYWLSNQLPNMFKTAQAGGMGSVVGGVAGLVASKLIPGPVDDILLIQMGMKAGGGSAAYLMSRRLMAGEAMSEFDGMVQEYGIAPEQAAEFARLIGAGGGLLEFVGLHSVASLVGGDVLARIGREAVIRTMKDPNLKILLKNAASAGKTQSVELSTELSQEMLNIVGHNWLAAANEEKGAEQVPFEEVKARLAQVTEATVLSLGLPLAGHAGIKTAVQTNWPTKGRITAAADLDAGRRAQPVYSDAPAEPRGGPLFVTPEVEEARSREEQLADLHMRIIGAQSLEDLDAIEQEIRALRNPRHKRADDPASKLITRLNNQRKRMTKQKETTDAPATPVQGPEDEAGPEQSVGEGRQEGAEGAAPGEIQPDKPGPAEEAVTPPPPPPGLAPGATEAPVVEEGAPSAPHAAAPAAGKQMSAPTVAKWSQIKRDPKRFQPRVDQEYDPDTAERIRADFVAGTLDLNAAPLVLWKDPKDGQDYVLAGNSRHAGIEMGLKETGQADYDMPVVYFQGTEQEARAFADIENIRRSQQSDLSSAAVFRRRIDAGESRKDVYADARRLLQKNTPSVWPLTFLAPQGKAITTLRAMPDDPRTQKAAKWVGQLREAFPQLTDAHEKELFDHILPRAGEELTSIDRVKKLVGQVVDDVFFNPDEPINIAQRTMEDPAEAARREQLAELQTDLDGFKGQLASTEKKIADVMSRLRSGTEPDPAGEFDIPLTDERAAELQGILDDKLLPLREEAAARIPEVEKQIADLKGKALKTAPVTGSLFGQEGVDVDLRKQATLTSKPRARGLTPLAEPAKARTLPETPAAQPQPAAAERSAAPPAPDTPPAATGGFGASNTLFTKERADAALEILKKKLGQVNVGVDPELMSAGIQLAGYYFEAGARSFADFTAQMIGALGDAVKPHLRGWYEALRYYPGLDTAGMTSPEDIKNEAVARIKRDHEAFQAMKQGEADKAAGARGVMMVNPDRPDQHVIVTPSASLPGKWQATHFMDGEPTGHTAHNTQEEAIKDRAAYGYRVVETANPTPAKPRGLSAPAVGTATPNVPKPPAASPAQAATIQESFARAEEETQRHLSAFRELLIRVPNGTVIAGWKKATIAGDVFWEKGNKSVVNLVGEVGGKAVASALGLPEDAAYNPQDYVTPQASAPAQETGRPGLVTQDQDALPSPNTLPKVVDGASYKGGLGEDQQYAVNLALRRQSEGGPAFLLADGTGVGKTREILAIADQMAQRGGKPVLIVTQNKQVIAGSFTDDSRTMGITLGKTIQVGTYDDLRAGKIGRGDYAAVIFDEAHNLKNADSSRSFAAAQVKAPFKVYATATPMDKAFNAAYFLAEISGMSELEVQDALGFRIMERRDETGKVVGFYPVLKPGYSAARVNQELARLRGEAVKNGAMIRREYPFYGEIMTDPIEQMPEEFLDLQEAVDDYWQAQIEEARSPRWRMSLAGQRIGELGRLAETFKTGPVMARVQEELKAGRTVIVVGENVNPSDLKGADFTTTGLVSNLAAALEQQGVRVARIYGDGDKSRAIADLQSGRAQVALMTPQSGGTGVNLDDVAGDRPRTMIIATTNWAGDQFDQILGRVSRRNTASPANVVFMPSPESLSDSRRAHVLKDKLDKLRLIQTGVLSDQLDIAAEEEGAPAVAPAETVARISDRTVGGITEVVVQGPATFKIKDELKATAERVRGAIRFDKQRKAWVIRVADPQDLVAPLRGLGVVVRFADQTTGRPSFLRADEGLGAQHVEMLDSTARLRQRLASRGVRVEIFATTEEASAALGHHVPDNAWGFHHKGLVGVIAENTPADQLEIALAHEILGHAGPEALGAAYWQAVDDISAAVRRDGASPRIRAIMDGLREDYTDEDGNYAFADDPRGEAREIVAKLAEDRKALNSDNMVARAWEAMKIQVRAWLAKMGFGNRLEAQIDSLILEAHTALRTGGPFAGYGMEGTVWKISRISPSQVQAVAGPGLANEAVQMGRAVRQAYRVVTDSVDRHLRKLAKKYPFLIDLANRGQAPHDVIKYETGALFEDTMYNGQARRMGQFLEGRDLPGLEGLNVILNRHKLSDNDLEEAVYIARHGDWQRQTAPEIMDTARLIRQLLDRFGDYLEENGLITREAREAMGPDYFPQVWDDLRIGLEPQAAIRDFADHFTTNPNTYTSNSVYQTIPEADRVAARKRAEQVDVDGVMYPRWANVRVELADPNNPQSGFVVRFETGHGAAQQAAVEVVTKITQHRSDISASDVVILPGMSVRNFSHRPAPGFTRRRKIGNVLDSPLEYWLVQGPTKMLTEHITRGVRSAEYNRAFGKGGARVKAAIKKMRAEGASHDDILAVQTAGDVWAGRLGASEQTASRLMRKVGTALIVVTTFKIMKMAFFTNLSELAANPARFGIWNAVKGAGQTIADFTPGLRQLLKTKGREYSRALGISGRLMTQNMLGEILMGEGLSNKALNLFYMANLLEPLTRLNRIWATNTALNYIKAIVKDWTPQNTRLDEWRRQMGMTEEDVLRIRQAGIEDAQGHIDEAVARALVRGVDQSNMRPTGSSKPAWMSDHRFTRRMFAMLKSFNFTFRDQVLSRAVFEARRGRPGQLITLSLLGTAISWAVMALRARWASSSSKEREEKDEENSPALHWMNQIMGALDRSGLTAFIPLLPDMIRSLMWGRPLVESMAAPLSMLSEGGKSLYQAGARFAYEATGGVPYRSPGKSEALLGTKGSYRPIVRFLTGFLPTGQIPVVSERITNALAPQTERPKSGKAKARSLSRPSTLTAKRRSRGLNSGPRR